MKLRNTILLLVLAGALFAFIRFYESQQLGSREAQERAGRVLTFDRDKVNAITIKNSEAKIELRKDDKGVWKVEEPVKDRADSLAVSQLFTTAEALRYDAVIGDEKKGLDKNQLKEYGLTSSETKIRFAGREKAVELLFGKDAAVEGKVYVKPEGSNIAYVIGKDLKEQISRKVDDFRDRKLTDVNTTQVTRVVIKTGAGEMELQKQDQHWSLTRPLKARGDDSRIGDLISQAATAHIERFIGDTANSSSYGLQEPRATITLWTEGGGKPTILQIGAAPKDEKDQGKIYAKVSSREGVVLLPKSIETLIGTKPNDLRDKNLVRFEADIVDRISIEGAGKEKIVLARKGESWVRKAGEKDESVNIAAARRVLAELQVQQVTAFVSDVAADLPKYGLDQPQIKVTLSSYASENTPETKAGERPIVTILFGKVEDGKVYVRVEDEPFIVSVPENAIEALMTDPLQWQPLEIYQHKPEEITAIEVMRQGQAPISIERDKEGNWKLAKGDGTVNKINAQSLANTLATLRAIRWVGPVKPDYGFEMPAVAVAFKTGGGSDKLTVGVMSTPDATPFATAEGLKGVFELSRPDLSAFQLALLEKAAPAAPAAGAAAPASPATPATPAPAPAPPAEARATPRPPQP